MIDALNRDGFCLVEDVMGRQDVDRLIVALERPDMHRSMRGQDVYGARNLLDSPAIRALAESKSIRVLVEPLIGNRARAVRGLFFDKTAGANWPVAWHQDRSVAVAERRDIPGWRKWTVKGQVVHVQPPQEFLAHMLTLRIHLDECGADNGPLKVVPGTHRRGVMRPPEITAARENQEPVTCIAPVGSVLLMKPLLLHASSAARTPHHRRVIHLEFAADDALPADLSWAA